MIIYILQKDDITDMFIYPELGNQWPRQILSDNVSTYFSEFILLKTQQYVNLLPPPFLLA